jgi:hypothetical protein
MSILAWMLMWAALPGLGRAWLSPRAEAAFLQAIKEVVEELGGKG